jgi:predicted DNA-binding transcriptional regulator YafY
MLDTSVRLLKLLTLLQIRRDWSGAELAGRLGVTTRTIRNDIERLRIMGYEVSSSNPCRPACATAWTPCDRP